MATKEQLAANRKNARKSTGPKSPAGKDISKLNRLTHGLRTEQVVLLSEDAAEFQAFVDAWMADWKPRTMARAQLVREAAVAAWRKERCVRSESTRLGRRIRETIQGWRTQQDQAIDGAVAVLPDDPAGAMKQLFATRAGVERLIAMWTEIARAAAMPDGWDDADAHHRTIVALLGPMLPDDHAALLRDNSWRLYLRNAPEQVADDDLDPLDDAEACRVAALLGDLAAAELTDLRDALVRLPDPTPTWLRHAEADALVPRKEDVLLLRYETQRSREFHRALNDLTKMARTGSDLVEVEGDEEELPTEANSAEVQVTEEVEGDFSGVVSREMTEEVPSAAVATVVEVVPAVAGADWGAGLTRKCA